MEFTNKVVLVTGASRGIGNKIAVKFAEKGATVIGTATTANAASTITKKISKISAKSHGIKFDANYDKDYVNLFSLINSAGKMPDILINNAGITNNKFMMRIKDEEWSKVIQTNLTAIFKITKTCVRYMLKNYWGRIINIGSVVGSSGNAGQASYAASKAGILGLSKSLAYEVASRNITVNTIAPGFIDTSMTAILNEQIKENILSKIPMGRLGQPEEIAEAALYLASNKAGYITGQTLHVNGGLYMM